MTRVAKFAGCAHEWLIGPGGNWDAGSPGHIQHLKRVFADIFQTSVPVDTRNTQDHYLRIAGCVENSKGVINAGVNIKNYAYGQFICALFSVLLKRIRGRPEDNKCRQSKHFRSLPRQ
jgi:hypothetical protein